MNVSPFFLCQGRPCVLLRILTYSASFNSISLVWKDGRTTGCFMVLMVVLRISDLIMFWPGCIAVTLLSQHIRGGISSSLHSTRTPGFIGLSQCSFHLVCCCSSCTYSLDQKCCICWHLWNIDIQFSLLSSRLASGTLVSAVPLESIWYRTVVNSWYNFFYCCANESCENYVLDHSWSPPWRKQMCLCRDKIIVKWLWIHWF